MPLPTDFQFSQSSLQDYLDCPRRFELRYILKQKWPAIQTEPVIEFERHMEIGTRFHRLVQQHILGIPDDVLEAGIADPDLLRWWHVFRRYAPLKDLPHPYLPEYRLAAAFAGQRLVAQYDLLSIDPGQSAVIIDWKTSAHRPSSINLQQRIQSRLYPFLLVLAGGRLNNGHPFEPEQITMRYWFPGAPDKPEIIGYTKEQHEENKAFFTGLLSEIVNTPDGRFLLTADESKCKYCQYRSLCERQVEAGDWKQAEDSDFSSPDQGFLDIEQIGDIIF
ncbi:MAG: PD-(D/E)XK nuclease family protein [Anaerolineaceae bacterium]|jgi:CRISPR/Cas system-associated exonuclease Cas4 (RecB family)|nr:PD-(D/E)XK nuclease family protein [Anaerolineaceae bacterium]